MSIQRLFNGGGAFDIQSTTGFLCIQASSLPYLAIGNNSNGIILTQSPNNTTTSTITVSRTMNVKINAFFNVYSGGTAYNPQFAFWNITDSFSEIWGVCTVNAGQTIDNNLIGVCTLTLGKSYTLDFGNSTTFAGV